MGERELLLRLPRARQIIAKDGLRLKLKKIGIKGLDLIREQLKFTSISSHKKGRLYEL